MLRPSKQLADTTSLYVVQVAGDPVASYDGDIAGLAATRPAKGQKLDAHSAAAKAYRNYLDARHSEVLDRSNVADSKKIRDLSTTFNGFTARLTDTEARQLEHTKGVTNVWKNEIVEVDTVSTPDFLGLTGANGVWNRQFGGAGRAGEGVIVGILDTGFWPENASFGALPEPRPDQAIINAKWHGTCDVGTEEFVTCNNKVIGARWYNASNSRSRLSSSRRVTSTVTARTPSAPPPATTASQPPSMAAPSETSAGMAPAARLRSTRCCGTTRSTGGASGGTVDLVAAIEDAVADGVDVINYSISGSRSSSSTRSRSRSSTPPPRVSSSPPRRATPATPSARRSVAHNSPVAHHGGGQHP